MNRTEALEWLLTELKQKNPYIIVGLRDKDVSPMVSLHSQHLGIGVEARYWTTIQHKGFGFFQGETPNGWFSFDGGGAMMHLCPIKGDYVSASPLRVENQQVLEDLNYPFEVVISAIEKELSGEP